MRAWFRDTDGSPRTTHRGTPSVEADRPISNGPSGTSWADGCWDPNGLTRTVNTADPQWGTPSVPDGAAYRPVGTVPLRESLPADAPQVPRPADEDAAVGEGWRRVNLLPEGVLRQHLEL